MTRDDADGVPQLTPVIVADDEALARLVDRLHVDDAHVGARTLEIGFAETDLAGMISADAWARYVAVHSMTLLHEVLLVRWAFEEGRRYPLSPTPGGER